MLAALTVWLLSRFGLQPTPEDLLRMEREYRERGHHLAVDFGGTRFGTTRWSDDEFRKLLTIGLSYEYLVDRTYNSVSVEAVAQSLGAIFRGGSHAWFTGGGFGYYPIRPIHLFMHAGALFKDSGQTQALGRLGAGFRFTFFKTALQPFGFVQTSSTGQFGWGIAFRVQY